MSGTPRLELVSLTARGTHILIWGNILTIAALAVWTFDEVWTPAPTILGLVIMAAVGVILTLDRDEPMSRTTALLVALAWIAVALLVSWQLKEPGGHGQWFYGAGTIALYFVALRERQYIAWLGFAAISAIVAAWTISVGLGPLVAVLLIAKQLPIMLVSSLFAYGLRRTTADILRLTEETSTRASVEAAQVATTAERNARLAELDAIATPLLTRLVDGTPLTDDDRLEFAVTEAQLRDGLRARSLSVPEVVAAAQDARRRGIQVVLLDDLYPAAADPTVLAAVQSRVAAALRTATDGRVVARLLPEGRDEIATILVDGESEQRRDVVRAL